MSLSTGVGRFLLFDRRVSGAATLVHQRKNTFAYDGERRVLVVTNVHTNEKVRARGNRLYVWGSTAGPGSLVHADVDAPPEPYLRFEHLRNRTSFDLFLDRNLYVEGLVVRHRRALRPRFYVRPFACEP